MWINEPDCKQFFTVDAAENCKSENKQKFIQDTLQWVYVYWSYLSSKESAYFFLEFIGNSLNTEESMHSSRFESGHGLSEGTGQFSWA